MFIRLPATEVFGETLVHLSYWSAPGLTRWEYLYRHHQQSDTEYIHRTHHRKPEFPSLVEFDKAQHQVYPRILGARTEKIRNHSQRNQYISFCTLSSILARVSPNTSGVPVDNFLWYICRIKCMLQAKYDVLGNISTLQRRQAIVVNKKLKLQKTSRRKNNNFK